MEIKLLGLVCVIVLLSQLLLVESNSQKEGRKDKERKDKTQGDDGRKSAKNEEKEQAGSNQNEKGQKPKGVKGSPKGKFSSKEKADCTWAASEAGTVSLKVECKQGGESFWCVFAGNPSSCAQFSANQNSYWKQISRALKKQKNICQDPKAVLKSKECKKGPQEAHLRLLGSSLVETAQSKEQKKTHHGKKSPQRAEVTVVSNSDVPDHSDDCVADGDTVDQKKVAEDYCGESWSSLCTFFFSMLQNRKC